MKALITIFLSLLLWGSAAIAGQRVEADTDKDGRTDQIAHYDVRGRLLRLEVDSCGDGRFDRVQFYENQVLSRVERDTDHDGSMDCTDHYTGGKRVRQVRTDRAGRTCQVILFDALERVSIIRKDSTGDGQFDLFYYYEKGELARSEKDTDANGRINIWQTWSADTPVELRADQDEDSQVERVIRFSPDGLPAESEHDTDGDGRMETFRRYEEGHLVLEEKDTNQDGRADRTTRFQKDLPVWLEKDENFDGRPDYTCRFDSLGKAARITEDTDFDGRTDRIRYFEKGVPLRTEHDSDHDGFLETASLYRGGRLDSQTRDLNRDRVPDQWTWFNEKGERTRVAADTDFNGKKETWHFFEDNRQVRLEKDESGDGRVDLKVFYKDEKQVRLTKDRGDDGCFEITQVFGAGGWDRQDRVDADCDGKIETLARYRAGVLRERESDEDLDGRMDFIEIFSPEGRLARTVESTGPSDRLVWIYDDQETPVRAEQDSDQDQKTDTWFYFDRGVLSRVEEDTNGDGRPDLWETYDESERLVLEEKDLDYDGASDVSRAWAYAPAEMR